MMTEFESLWDGHFGRADVTTYRINVIESGKMPLYRSPYFTHPQNNELEMAETDKMLSKVVVEPASTEGLSPTLSAPKRHRSPRLCVDDQKQNAFTVRHSYPTSCMEEFIDSFGDTKIIATLLVNAGYLQIEMDEDVKEKTEFFTHQWPHDTCLQNGDKYRRKRFFLPLCDVYWRFVPNF